MSNELLRAENMTVGYGGVPLIRDIALSVGRRNPDAHRPERLRQVHHSQKPHP